ncbi:MAG: NAD(P)H-dependent oxidoreductase, partial [Shewanella sp.]
MKRVLVIFSHPSLQNSRANSQLLAAIKDLEEVYVHDLYQHYPDMFIDVKQEQALLEGYDIIVFQHPFYWYSCPAIMKEWMDMVLTYGYAYGRGGQALKDKQWLSVLTTGGAPESY